LVSLTGTFEYDGLSSLSDETLRLRLCMTGSILSLKDKYVNEIKYSSIIVQTKMAQPGKAIVAYQPEDGVVWKLEDVAVREPSDTELQVRIVAAGICHSDVVCSSVPAERQQYPIVVGHEGYSPGLIMFVTLLIQRSFQELDMSQKLVPE
jgi:hypothetical protein